MKYKSGDIVVVSDYEETPWLGHTWLGRIDSFGKLSPAKDTWEREPWAVIIPLEGAFVLYIPLKNIKRKATEIEKLLYG